MKKTLFAAALLLAAPAFAGDAGHIELKKTAWPFDGHFGKVDKQSAQRGFQVYKEVCSACHGLSLLSFRNVQALGFSEAEVKALAASYTVKDGPGDDGEMFERPGKPFDKFPSPYANEQAARAAQNGAYPPDLSLMVKARPDGANYMHSLLTGYTPVPTYNCKEQGADGNCLRFEPVEQGGQFACASIAHEKTEDKATGKEIEKETCVKLGEGMHYNAYFPGHQIAMPAPLSDGRVDYADGTQASVDQMSHDVTVFLQWAAEPEMEHRKQMGIKVLMFLAVFTVLCYIAKKRVWARLDSH